jgi:hypothetical protein
MLIDHATTLRPSVEPNQPRCCAILSRAVALLRVPERREVWHPAYQVHFWKSISPTGWQSREFEVSNGDVVEVLLAGKE